MIKLVECPRDAMQGIREMIPTEKKIAYINQLLQVGFDTIDFGSFVSPKAIPQMADTAAVLAGLDMSTTKSKLLAIVANKRGAFDACQHDEITYMGYPFSISETFQLRNTNATIEKSVDRVQQIQDLCVEHSKELVVYISMGFGNPYGDEWNVELVQKWTDRLFGMGIRILSLSDTIGVSSPESIQYLFNNLIPKYPEITFGAHLHTQPHNWKEKIAAAYQSGCHRFDGALRGYGGCPMAKDELTGNMAMENIISYFKENEVDLGLDVIAFEKGMAMTGMVFPAH
ncbi:MAG: hydroxymethylglutaryl-CoA lyase [Saprospiraceae bacterium]|jgi:hydroxymethylglutaryl-CoA lyase